MRGFLLVVFMARTVPLVEKTAQKKDRRFAAILFLSLTCVGEVILKCVGLDVRVGNFPIMCILSPALLGMGAGTFWTLFYSMGYDLVELDEFKNGKRRESIITALPQLVQKFGSAFGILAAGQLLSLYGYDASADVAGQEDLIHRVTDAHIVNGMENIATSIPAVLIAVSVLACVAYPMTRKTFEALKTQLEKKRAGETYSTEGFQHIL